MDAFKEASNLYFDRQFAQAVATFDGILKINQKDLIAQHFRDQSAKHLLEGVPEDWDGIERLLSK